MVHVIIMSSLSKFVMTFCGLCGVPAAVGEELQEDMLSDPVYQNRLLSPGQVTEICPHFFK